MKTCCNCGSFRIDWDTKISPLVARMCGCDYCAEAKGEFVSDPSSRVTFSVTEPSNRNIVTHGHGTALFYECKNCGVIIVTSEIGGELYCVINAKVLNIKGYSLDKNLKDFSGESIQERLARRKNNWSKAIMHSDQKS